MKISTMNVITDWVDKAVDFVDKNWSNPGFWLVAFIGLLALGLLIISKFADK